MVPEVDAVVDADRDDGTRGVTVGALERGGEVAGVVDDAHAQAPTTTTAGLRATPLFP